MTDGSAGAAVRSALLFGGLLVTGAAALDARRRVRRMRLGAVTVEPLHLDVDVPGRFPPRSVVVLGDSASAGHGLPDPETAGARLVGRGLKAADGRATEIRSVAVDGATTADVLEQQLDAARGAEVVLVGVGANDALAPGGTLHELREATERLLTAVRGVAATDAMVVLLSCPDLSRAPSLPVVLRPVVGWRCRRTAAAQLAVAAAHGVPVIELSRTHLTAEVFGTDGFHPGVLGHARMAERVLALLTIGTDPAPPAGPGPSPTTSRLP